MWERSQTEEGKQNVLKECEQWWFFDFHSCFYWKYIMDLRNKENEIKNNYITNWEIFKEKEKDDLKNWESQKQNYSFKKRKRDEFINELKLGYQE